MRDDVQQRYELLQRQRLDAELVAGPPVAVENFGVQIPGARLFG